MIGPSFPKPGIPLFVFTEAFEVTNNYYINPLHICTKGYIHKHVVINYFISFLKRYDNEKVVFIEIYFYH